MKTIDGITITPIKDLQFKKKKEGRYDKILQKLPKDYAFSVKGNQCQSVRLAARKMGVKVSIWKQENGLYAVMRR
ncbi:MAG TPA: hypothetical protein VIK96_04665 [Bacilli bacterium]